MLSQAQWSAAHAPPLPFPHNPGRKAGVVYLKRFRDDETTHWGESFMLNKSTRRVGSGMPCRPWLTRLVGVRGASGTCPVVVRAGVGNGISEPENASVSFRLTR
jgi:hypothetical protein